MEIDLHSRFAFSAFGSQWLSVQRGSQSGAQPGIDTVTLASVVHCGLQKGLVSLCWVMAILGVHLPRQKGRDSEGSPGRSASFALASSEPVDVEAVSLREMGRVVPCSAFRSGL